MTSFGYRLRLLLFFILFAWMSVSDPTKTEAAAPTPAKETTSQLRHIANANSMIPAQTIVLKNRKGLKKEPSTTEFRRKKSSSRTNQHEGIRKKVRKTVSPLDPPQHNQELSYHGMLENPRRYDPSLDQQNGAVPNPKVRDVRLDHFQELDKNQDGLVDPLERATSRLDIDRDVSNHQWK